MTSQYGDNDYNRERPYRCDPLCNEVRPCYDESQRAGRWLQLCRCPHFPKFAQGMHPRAQITLAELATLPNYLLNIWARSLALRKRNSSLNKCIDEIKQARKNAQELMIEAKTNAGK